MGSNVLYLAITTKAVSHNFYNTFLGLIKKADIIMTEAFEFVLQHAYFNFSLDRSVFRRGVIVPFANIDRRCSAIK